MARRVSQQWLFYVTLLLSSGVNASGSMAQLGARWVRPWTEESGSDIFREQMVNPSEVFSVLLIIGGDIIQKAVAQMSGRRVTLIAFSFGWVAYAFNTLMSAFGDGSLMPDPEFGAEVITVSSRIKKSNNSWTLSRLIRDLEREVGKSFDTWYEVDEETDDKRDIGLVRTNVGGLKCRKTGNGSSGLLVTFCKTSDIPGKPRDNLGFYAFFATVTAQFGVAIIPIIFWGNWSVLFVTGFGTCLAIITVSMREWRLEKYQARKKTGHTYAITRGNGHPHVFIIQNGTAKGLFLDDLAGAVRKADIWTRIKSCVLAAIWICFLITAGGLKAQTWFLLGVGIIGMIQNVWVAGRHRKSSEHGIPLEIGETYGRKERGKRLPGLATNKLLRLRGKPVYETARGPKVMNVLMQVESVHSGLGLALLPEFFPHPVWRGGEEDWWKRAEAHRKDPNNKPAPIPGVFNTGANQAPPTDEEAKRLLDQVQVLLNRIQQHPQMGQATAGTNPLPAIVPNTTGP